ncbi:hypothetical protein DPMN_186642 [Dreissena polymorpha]|uniref:Uncharacterized protein n=1 Tax=Dreissena polymorpha TaxID=45954 RepID=A0A9D4I8C3_DREPO|nr:hypothetical protein DPMN_186642 [Dreissena polymorpha]
MTLNAHLLNPIFPQCSSFIGFVDLGETALDCRGPAGVCLHDLTTQFAQLLVFRVVREYVISCVLKKGSTDKCYLRAKKLQYTF